MANRATTNLVCLVGTSLSTKLGRDIDIGSVGVEEAAEILLGRENLSDAKLFSAEITSTYALVRRGLLLPGGCLALVSSDTPVGRKCAEILRVFFRKKSSEFRFSRVEVRTVPLLDHSDPGRFRRGLVNLAFCLFGLVEELGGDLIINATGGFKVEMGIAFAVGQECGVPVCYMFEEFGDVLVLPNLPFRFVGVGDDPYASRVMAALVYVGCCRERNLGVNAKELARVFPELFREKCGEKEREGGTLELLFDVEDIGGETIVDLSKNGTFLFKRAVGENPELVIRYLPRASEGSERKLLLACPAEDAGKLRRCVDLEGIANEVFIRRITVRKVEHKGHGYREITAKPGGVLVFNVSTEGATYRIEIETTARSELCARLVGRYLVERYLRRHSQGKE